MKTVIQDLESLQDMSPVLALVVQALVQHVHNLIELVRSAAQSLLDLAQLRGKRSCVRVEGHLCDLAHLCPGWTPWVITGRYGESAHVQRADPRHPYHSGP